MSHIVIRSAAKCERLLYKTECRTVLTVSTQTWYWSIILPIEPLLLFCQKKRKEEISLLSRLITVLNRGVPWASTHLYSPLDIRTCDFLHNTSFNTFPCVHVMQHRPTNSHERLIHTHASNQWYFMLSWFWRLFPLRARRQVEEGAWTHTHKVTRKSRTPRAGDSMNRVFSVCD